MKIYLVGGAVRDALLNLPVVERDYVVVGATAEQLIELGYQPVGKDFPVFLHPKTHEEYALARTERKSGKGYTGFQVYASPSVTLEQDLARRDLTINAMAQQNGVLVDPFHGQRDIERKVLRHVSPAFVEDPLRVLRVARFAARFAHLGFTIAAETQTLMRQIVAQGEISHLVPERVWAETEKALVTQSPAVFFQVLHNCGALQVLLELPDEAAAMLSDNRWPTLGRSTTIVENMEKEHCVSLRYACFVYDLGTAIKNHHAAYQLCKQHLRAPNRCHELAALNLAATELLARSNISADTALAFYQRLDIWRKPERAEQLQQLLQCIPTSTEQQQRVDKLFAAIPKLRSIQVQDLVAEGLTGPEIGKVLTQRRLQVLQSIWH
ncbi:multifunctional CCA tRNA nucleotidyl transferase/2'3'-cyclic phosphodiesterase/2'nucleotidase/phosphatase [Aliidiomarina celeris]|uniref:multifunctional CCA tRNA nucleotidyl transferase/2'3'-cyclic phosphodiesterase/2'nucleotidase/phosphatase n=1 Tax=Aliidiomarina celeris TaxID=2249428 RepID=UPI000DE8D05F|nr:multifunctional CCA tRNA nucleotidyl transferase/2'3'-cyclic phosphodiesterase/2'nucleotidase/phosphatase [Aliidiomarina celeris]